MPVGAGRDKENRIAQSATAYKYCCTAVAKAFAVLYKGMTLFLGGLCLFFYTASAVYEDYMTEQKNIAVVGGGLAGCECALTLARAGIAVTLFEQKPAQRSPAHTSPFLAELVCSNSLRNNDTGSGIGLLKAEMRALGSAFMHCADSNAVPAGKALAVDREAFARAVTAMIEAEPLITVVQRQISALEDPALAGFAKVVIAAGPLASENLSASLAAAVGAKQLYFYDAIAPIVAADSLDRTIIFRASRYDCEKESAAEGEESVQGDYLNCPMNRDEYLAFYNALLAADKVTAHDFEKEVHFEGCMPIEALAERGEKTLTFGPMKPVGFIDPRTGRRPWAVVQLRQETANASSYNLVGCQTKLTYSAQREVFRRIPGLEKAEFVRFGSMHRNTYVNAPQVLGADLHLVGHENIYLAGQITGVEGYVESAACGLILGMMLVAQAQGTSLPTPPEECALGALMAHLRRPVKKFQPSNAHFGLMPDLGERAKKKDRKALYSQRAQEAFAHWLTLLPR